MDHALGQTREIKGKLETTERAHVEANKKLKETISQLAEVEKSRKNAEAALASYEKQAVECIEAQKRVENQLALTMVNVKQQKK